MLTQHPLGRALLGMLFICSLFGVYLFFTAFLYSQNALHALLDPAIAEIELFKGSQNLSELPSVFNSDLVMPFLLAQDLIHNPRSLAHWVLSPAWYAFPDWLIAIGLVALPIPNKLLPLFYSATQLSALTLAMGILIASVTHKNWQWTSIFVATIFLCCGMVIILFPGSALSYSLWMWLGSPYIHAGAVLMSLIGVVITLKLIQSSTLLLMHRLALAFIIFFTTLADFIFILWFVVPASMWLIWLNYMHGSRQALGLLPIVIVPSIAAVGLESVIRQTIKPESKVHLNGSFSQWLDDLHYLWTSADYPMIVLIFANAILILYCMKVLVTRQREHDESGSVSQLEVFLGLICLVALVTPLLINAYRGLALWRYFLILTIIPPIWFCTRISAIFNRTQFQQYVLLPSGLITIAVMVYIFTPSLRTIQTLRAPTTLEHCLREHNLQVGYGDYWNAKALIFASHRQVHVIQLLGDKPYPYATNQEWFSKHAKSNEPIQPNFIILENLSAQAMRQRFGEPDEMITCANKVLWKYHRTLPLALPE